MFAMCRKTSLAAALSFGFICLATTASAATNMLFILDSSNSMWKQIDGVSKIETAKSVLGGLLKDLPPDTKVGLMAYGHRTEGSCDDIELVSGIGEDSPAALLNKIGGITPKGKTPIAGALKLGGISFGELSEENNNVVLISDGIETCSGDPCEAAKALAEGGINVRVHVIGFDLKPEERKQLECISENGKGRYFGAGNAAELKAAIAEVQTVAQAEPEPPPQPEPKIAEYFRDDFDGDALGAHWEVINPDTDNYLVENGELLIIAGTPGKREDLTIRNLFRLKKPMPEGDWVATAKMKVAFATKREGMFLGLVEDKDNALYTWLQIWGNRFDHAWMELYCLKRSKGQEKSNKQQIYDWLKQEDVLKMSKKPFFLRLAKTGHAYVASVKHGDEPEAAWTELPKSSILKQKGKLAFGLTQGEQVSGDTQMTVDWVKIETVR